MLTGGKGADRESVYPPQLAISIYFFAFICVIVYCQWVDYRSVNVQCPNSTQDNTILMMVLEAVM